MERLCDVLEVRRSLEELAIELACIHQTRRGGLFGLIHQHIAAKIGNPETDRQTVGCHSIGGGIVMIV